MNAELQKKMVEILASIQEAVARSSTFVLEQLPDIAQQYLLYGRTVATMGLLLGLVLISVCVWCFIKGRKHANEGFIIGAILSGVGGSVITLVSLERSFMVWLAPKVWLLQELSKLLK